MPEEFYIYFWIIFISFFSLSMLLLTLESRFKKKVTTILVLVFSILLIIANCYFYSNKNMSAFEVYNIFTILLPQMIFIFLIGKRGFIATVTSALNTYISIYTIQILKSIISRYIPNNFMWTEYFYIVFYPIIWIFVKQYYINLHNDIEKISPKLISYLLLFSLVIYGEIIAYGYLIRLTTEHVLRFEIFGVAVLSIYYVSFFIFYKIIKSYNFRLQEMNVQELKNRELEYLDDRLKVREQKEQQLKIIRHDLRHVLITIKQLLYNNNIIEANKIIEKYTENVDSLQLKSYCNDSVIDSVIDYYANICTKHNITFNVQVNNFEEVLNIPNYDFAIFISNCLENAVNATKKLQDNKRIDFTFLNNKGRLVLQIKNTYNGRIKIKNGKPVSRSKYHGIGTSSIEWFAKRHNLDLDYQITKELFVISVLFNH